jgi:hypothetical protein
VTEAREIVGETAVSSIPTYGYVEPIPESQEEINKQADAAIRDLFPRVPNTDRIQIIEHAFKKVTSNASMFHFLNFYRALCFITSRLLDCSQISLFLAEFN